MLEGEGIRPRWQWAMGAIAGLAALAVVGSLLYFRLFTDQHRAAGQPIGHVNVASGIGLKCTLPVTGYQTAALISFPDGAVTVDPSVKPVAGGKGIYQYSWDAKLGRWLPVDLNWISPDGGSYGYVTNTSGVPGEPVTSEVHAKDAGTGRDRQLWRGQGSSQLIGWVGGSLYFTRQLELAGQPGYGMEVWAVDVASAAARRVGPNPPPAPPKPGEPSLAFGFGPNLLGGGALWAATMSHPLVLPTEPPKPGAYIPKGPDRVTRMDLKDGTQAAWYTVPEGRMVTVAGFDVHGHPLLAVNEQPRVPVDKAQPYPAPPAPRYFLLTGPDQAAELAIQPDPAEFRGGQAVGDSQGIWFAGPGSLWIYASGSFKKVADIPASLFPMSTPPPGAISKPPPGGAPCGPYIRLAGPCT